MDLSASAVLPCPPEVAYAEVADLSGYPAWLTIVREVRSGDDGSWSVDLGARMGPIGRTKTVRMVRTADERPAHVRFERAELDGRQHSAWVLDARLEPGVEGATDLVMSLHYGGARWLPLLDLVLAQEVHRAGGRLADQIRRR